MHPDSACDGGNASRHSGSVSALNMEALFDIRYAVKHNISVVSKFYKLPDKDNNCKLATFLVRLLSACFPPCERIACIIRVEKCVLP